MYFQRSYRKELFDDAISRMRKARIKTEQEINKFRRLQDKVEELVRAKNLAETDYGEIPDEFKGIRYPSEMYSVFIKNFVQLYPKV